MVSTLFFGGILIWRGQVARARLPRLGIEHLLMTGIIIAVLSLLTHLNPHGVTRVTMWIAYWLLVYLLVDLFDIGVQKRAVVAALVVSTGLLNLISLAEIAQKYIVWWQANNSIWISPPCLIAYLV